MIRIYVLSVSTIIINRPTSPPRNSILSVSLHVYTSSFCRCVRCTPGTYLVEGSCVPCGCVTENTASNSNVCDDNGQCHCLDGFPYVDSSSCERCPSRTFLGDGKCEGTCHIFYHHLIFTSFPCQDLLKIKEFIHINVKVKPNHYISLIRRDIDQFSEIQIFYRHFLTSPFQTVAALRKVPSR